MSREPYGSADCPLLMSNRSYLGKFPFGIADCSLFVNSPPYLIGKGWYYSKVYTHTHTHLELSEDKYVSTVVRPTSSFTPGLMDFGPAVKVSDSLHFRPWSNTYS